LKKHHYSLGLLIGALALTSALLGSSPVELTPVVGKNGMVVAGHPEASAAGIAVLKEGGNAIDAAVAVSLCLGVAEPYGSGLGGKLMMLYYDSSTGKTFVIDAMDAAGASLDVAAYQKRPEEDRSIGYGSAAVPGLAAGLWMAHGKWGALPWSSDVAPSIALARGGFEILPKTRGFFREQEKKLRSGNSEIARLYLPGGQVPVIGSRLKNEDLARTLESLAAKGRDGFYKGPVAKALVDAAVKGGGGTFSLDDLAAYEPRITEPIGIDFRGYRILSSPPPSNGAPLFLAIMKVLEEEHWKGPLREAHNLDLLGRTWREVQPRVQNIIGDVPESLFNFEKLVAPDSIEAIRKKVIEDTALPAKVAWFDDSGWSENAAAATTHFVVIDGKGNIVCATQSLSLHFGAAVVPPGTGVVLNNSMSNFAYGRSGGVNFIAAGKRPRSTISPSIVFKSGKPIIAIGIPGSSRIPTAMLQALLDRLAFNRPLAEAIGDTRFHFDRNWRNNNEETFESEQSLPSDEVGKLRTLGWKVELPEQAGTGQHFGGINAIEISPDGSFIGYADPRRTNAAAGY
jgi:gamma-glutamyltranspeptidase/glutathione hydrolase